MATCYIKSSINQFYPTVMATCQRKLDLPSVLQVAQESGLHETKSQDKKRNFIDFLSSLSPCTEPMLGKHTNSNHIREN